MIYEQSRLNNTNIIGIMYFLSPYNSSVCIMYMSVPIKTECTSKPQPVVKGLRLKVICTLNILKKELKEKIISKTTLDRQTSPPASEVAF